MSGQRKIYNLILILHFYKYNKRGKEYARMNARNFWGAKIVKDLLYCSKYLVCHSMHILFCEQLKVRREL